MSEIKSFAIFFDDLVEETQRDLCREFRTSPEDENWDAVPLCIIEREMKEV